MVYRVILPAWAVEEFPNLPKVQEGEFTEAELRQLNEQFYNIYWLPNSPSVYEKGNVVDGSHIDQFDWVYVDMDLKEGIWSNKQEFIDAIHSIEELKPTLVIDSGNGIHVYWQVSDLDPMSFLRLQRRLCRFYKTDEAVAKIYQLMRLPGTINTKNPDDLKLCETIEQNDVTYTCEQLDKLLPVITSKDEEYCKQHYAKTFERDKMVVDFDDKMPPKFGQLLKNSPEVKEIWAGGVDDRSKADYRLGHIMFANGFTKLEARAVLVNSAKAVTRAPIHRQAYADNIIDKIWTEEETPGKEPLSKSVMDILSKSTSEELRGTRLRCHQYVDNTEHGFRLSQVIGLVAGVGVGKTAFSLNFFKWFVENNPDYLHLFVSLEQPAREIAQRWEQLCEGDTRLHNKVHILSNYNDDGTYRNLSLCEIQDYILEYQNKYNKKFGCVVIDHLGVLRKQNKNGENEGLIQVCQQLKSFAIVTNTLLVIQSQSNREKAGIGDLELFKDAAYGTQAFESFLDFLMVLWQPLKRCYSEEGCPTITSFKFCKIRFKNKELDKIKEDVRYLLYFDTKTGSFRETTEVEDKSFEYFNARCANMRKSDRKTEVVPYVSVRWTKKDKDENDKS